LAVGDVDQQRRDPHADDMRAAAVHLRFAVVKDARRYGTV
jgi:hypothetical protein